MPGSFPDLAPPPKVDDALRQLSLRMNDDER
jgi:hypothetical protein